MYRVQNVVSAKLPRVYHNVIVKWGRGVSSDSDWCVSLASVLMLASPSFTNVDNALQVPSPTPWLVVSVLVGS